jgi:hypothetical protein
MRSLILIIFSLLTCRCFSQTTINVTSVEITKTDFNSCVALQPILIKDSSDYDTLTLGTLRFRTLGVFKSPDMTLLKSLNDNKYSLVDNKSGWIETLLSFPVFSSDLKIFGCFGTSFGSETIKLYRITDERFEILCGFTSLKKVTQINCLTETSFYTKNIDDKYLKYNLEPKK